jgi:hypothetical protein
VRGVCVRARAQRVRVFCWAVSWAAFVPSPLAWGWSATVSLWLALRWGSPCADSAQTPLFLVPCLHSRCFHTYPAAPPPPPCLALTPLAPTRSWGPLPLASIPNFASYPFGVPGEAAPSEDVNLANVLVECLKRHPVLELTSADRDHVLRGLLQVTASIFSTMATSSRWATSRAVAKRRVSSSACACLQRPL